MASGEYRFEFTYFCALFKLLALSDIQNIGDDVSKSIQRLKLFFV